MKLQHLAVPIVFALLVYVALQTERNILKDRGRVRVEEHKTRDSALILKWSDTIEAPMTMRFEAALANYNGRVKTIILDFDSSGGSLREGQKMIEWIDLIKQKYRVETIIRAHRHCLSMCVPIYLQGEVRRAAASSRFMFHEPRLVNAMTDEVQEQPQFEKDWSSNRFFDRYFVNSEMDPDWRERLREQWVGKDIWFTGKELVEQHSGVVRELL